MCVLLPSLLAANQVISTVMCVYRCFFPYLLFSVNVSRRDKWVIDPFVNIVSLIKHWKLVLLMVCVRDCSDL